LSGFADVGNGIADCWAASTPVGEHPLTKRAIFQIFQLRNGEFTRIEAMMPTEVLGFYDMPEPEREGGQASLDLLTRAGARDAVEVSIVHSDGTRESIRIPQTAVAVLRDALAKLVDSERVAVLREDAELSPEQAAAILGISRPLVVRRMDSGRIPFRYVGAHRRCRLSDVLRLQQAEQLQRDAIDRLADDTEDLITNHGL
jgi:excisionase family DNA binding protein